MPKGAKGHSGRVVSATATDHPSPHGFCEEVSLVLWEKGGDVMQTRKEFLEAVMKMASLKDLQQADDAARAVISLTKAIIGEELSQKIAEVSPPDLRQGWESIQASQLDDYERAERLLEIGEVEEEGKPAI